MKRFISVAIVLYVANVAIAQSTDVLSKLQSFNISLNDITKNVQPTSTEYAFDMEYSVPDPKYPITYTASYDPKQSPAWKMTSWNGNTKIEKYMSNSLKDRVAKYATSPVVVDEATLKATKEGEYYVVSFRIVPTTAPKQYLYLKDCDGKAYINATSGKLEKTVWENFKPTKNGVVRVTKVQEEILFQNRDDVYQVLKESQFMGGSVDTKVGEKTGSANQVITYSNYRKVN